LHFIQSSFKEKDPVEIIKCILSNNQLMDELGNIIVQIEEVVKNGDLSGLTSLLSIFSMVEEVKSCFEETEVPQPVTDKEIVLKDSEMNLLACIGGYLSGIDESNCYFYVKKCWNNLSDYDKREIGNSFILDSLCSAYFQYLNHPSGVNICGTIKKVIKDNPY
jgi:hypothetical protein